MPDPGSLVVFAPNWLGDAVMALPAIADVRRRYPAARLQIAGRPAVAALFRLAPCADGVLTLEWRGRPLTRAGWAHDLDMLRGARPDAAILLPNSFASAWLARRAGIPARWGYATDMRRPLLTRAVRVPRGSRHQAGYYQHLVAALGIPSGGREAVLEVPDRAVDAAQALLTSRGWSPHRPLVAIAPGAAYGTAKRWMPAHYARLMTRLIRERGAQVVLVGSRADAAATACIGRLVDPDPGSAVIDLAGDTTLETLAGVLRLASVCVSNDSGAMHVAAAIGVPVVALFGPTREWETAPLPRQGARAEVLVNPVWCRPCMLRECPIDHRCMKGLSPERVFPVVTELMAGTR